MARLSLSDITFSITFPDVIATCYALCGFYEWRNVVIVNTLCAKGDTLIDIGSNIGTESLLFAWRLGPAGRVVVFEPCSETHVLDDLFQRGIFGCPRVIVMDVEGSELSILRGSQRILERCAPHVLLEVIPPLLRNRGVSVADLLESLETKNYKCWLIATWGLTPARRDQSGIMNWLCIGNAEDGSGDRTARRVSRSLVRVAIMPLTKRLNPAIVV